MRCGLQLTKFGQLGVECQFNRHERELTMLGYRIQQRSVLWPLVALLLPGFLFLNWVTHRTEVSYKLQSAFRLAVGNYMLIYEHAVENPSGVNFANDYREELPELFEQAQREGLMSDALWVDQALVYWRFSKDCKLIDWLDREKKALNLVKNRAAGSYYFDHVNALVTGVPLSKDQITKLESLQQNWPDDWWINALAAGSGMQKEPEARAAKLLQAAAWHRWMLGEYLLWGGLALSLALSWPAIKALRARWPVNKRSQRLMRYLPLALSLFAYSLWSLVAFVLTMFVTKAFGNGLLNMSADPMQNYQLQMLVWTLFVLGMLFWVPATMGATLAYGWGGVRKLFGLHLSSFLSVRVWVVALPSAGFLLLVTTLFSHLLSHASWGRGLMDGLSRYPESNDLMSVTCWFILGGLAGPLAEEIIFRGYLLSTLQNRFGKAWAVLGAALLFALNHAYSINGTLVVLIYGLALALLRVRTGSLAVCVLVHVLNNVISQMVSLLQGL